MKTKIILTIFTTITFTGANADSDAFANERFCAGELFRFQPAAKYWCDGQFR